MNEVDVRREVDVFVTLAEQSRPLSSSTRSALLSPCASSKFYFIDRPHQTINVSCVSARDRSDPRARRHSLVTSLSAHPPSRARSILSLGLSQTRGMIRHCRSERLGNAAEGYFAKIECLHFPRCLPWRNRSSIMATTECRIASQKRVKNAPTIFVDRYTYIVYIYTCDVHMKYICESAEKSEQNIEINIFNSWFYRDNFYGNSIDA